MRSQDSCKYEVPMACPVSGCVPRPRDGCYYERYFDLVEDYCWFPWHLEPFIADTVDQPRPCFGKVDAS